MVWGCPARGVRDGQQIDLQRGVADALVGSELQMVIFYTLGSGRNKVLRPCSELAAGVILGVSEGRAMRHTRCELVVELRPNPR